MNNTEMLRSSHLKFLSRKWHNKTRLLQSVPAFCNPFPKYGPLESGKISCRTLHIVNQSFMSGAITQWIFVCPSPPRRFVFVTSVAVFARDVHSRAESEMSIRILCVLPSPHRCVHRYVLVGNMPARARASRELPFRLS